VEQSISRRYLKLHIQNARREDSGLYTCRGWLGTDIGWDTETIRINMIGGEQIIVNTHSCSFRNIDVFSVRELSVEHSLTLSAHYIHM
jgi:hypothetical protein